MKHLVMLGTGQTHIHLLSSLATQPLAGVQITLVAPQPQSFYAGMLAGYVAGDYTLANSVIPLEPFLRHPAVTWLQRSVIGLDAPARTLTLDDGRALPYDMLSINNGPVQDKQKTEQLIPGAREHALFVRPLEPFAVLWPKVVALAEQKPLRVAVIGGGKTAVELACAVAHRLPASSVTLLTGDTPVLANHPPAVQAMVTQALKDRMVTVIQERAVGVAADDVTLASGARLACEVPLIAIGAQAPSWFQGSGLALNTDGFVMVDAFHRATSHPQVFAADEVATHVDLALLKNLRATLAGIEPSTRTTPAKTLDLLSCSNHHAMASWGKWSTQGRWVWWLKDWLDRRGIKSYSAR